MLAEDTEHTCILVGEMLFDGVADGHALTAETKLSTHLLVDTDIKFGHVDMLHDLLVEIEGIINFLLCRAIDVVVALHADTIDGHTSILHLLQYWKALAMNSSPQSLYIGD